MRQNGKVVRNIPRRLAKPANMVVDITIQLCKGFAHSEKGDPLRMMREAGESAPAPLSQYVCRQRVMELMIE